jgi:hypothetical protein
MDNPEKLATQVTQDKEKTNGKQTPTQCGWTPLSANQHK